MTLKCLAKIDWLPKKKGGRNLLPVGDKYAPIVKVTMPFIDSKEAWSLLVDIKERISSQETICEIEYLSDEAPDNLKRGVEFELYEGPKLVAMGVVL